MLDSLVGVSHECDYPEEVNRKPRVTLRDPRRGAAERGSGPLGTRDPARSGHVYTMDEDLVRRLRLDAFLTQRLCDAWAV